MATSHVGPVVRTGDIPAGTGRALVVDGHAIAVFNLSGSYFAIANECPHRGGALGAGQLDGAVVTCPLHAWQFDVRTGECVGRPDVRVACFPVTAENGDVCVELPQRDESRAGGEFFLVRFGAMGHVGKFRATAVPCSRGSRVVVRSSRGLELGEVLLAVGTGDPIVDGQPESGELLREMTDDDRVLERRLCDGKQRAFDACRRLLEERRLAIDLIDAEQLFDGQTLIFYFLGEAPPQMAEVTNQLAEQYAMHVQFRPFGAGADDGCGSACAREAGGCGLPGCGGGQCAAEG